ncbi:6919_t:CDS:2, partial [Cetraspora pellucida]
KMFVKNINNINAQLDQLEKLVIIDSLVVKYCRQSLIKRLKSSSKLQNHERPALGSTICSSSAWSTKFVN